MKPTLFYALGIGAVFLSFIHILPGVVGVTLLVICGVAGLALDFRSKSWIV